MRELADRWQERRRADWQPTAWLLAMLNNVNATEKKGRKTPSDFDIFGPKKRPKPALTLKQQIAAIRPFWRGDS